MKLSWKQGIVVALCVVAMIVVWVRFGANTFVRGRTVIGPTELKALDAGNAGINIVVTRPWFTDSVLVLNVGEPDDDRDFDRIDATRCLLQCAKHLENEPFKRLYLANKWTRLYYLDNADVRKLGQRYHTGESWSNAALYIEVAQHARTLNDSLAFKPGTGPLAQIANVDNWNTMMGNLMR
ncbi:MAG: hypothetical protein IJ632_03015 [Muribaculaceae bacterium]|nr:hypothetical protein [Muribaculaceae bacterium]